MNVEIYALGFQINALKNAKEMMKLHWNEYTNEVGFKMAEHTFIKNVVGVDYICPFSYPFNDGAKPFLADMYQEMTDKMIKELERQLKELM